jgi:hypothetical protein
MKILGIAALALILTASVGTANAQTRRDDGRGWREHSRQWDRGEHGSRHWDRGRQYVYWGRRNYGGYGSSYSPYSYGGQSWYYRVNFS